MGRLFIFALAVAVLVIFLVMRQPPEPVPGTERDRLPVTPSSGPRLVHRAPVPGESSQPPPAHAGEAPETAGEDGPSSALRDELVGRLIESGAMNASVDELDHAFENLSSDGSADAAVAANLHNEFASNKAMADYFLTQMDCREDMCRGEIRAMDGMPFDNDTLAALAVSLRELQPAGPYTVYVSGDDPTSARVFLTTGD